MNTTTSTIEQAQQRGAQFLIQDLELATTCMDIAMTRTDAANAQNDYEIARRAYDTVANYVMHTSLTRAEHEIIVEQMRALAERLREFERRLTC